MIDVNVSLSHWPFRRLPLDEAPALVAALKKLGVTRAWTGSFDSLLHRDVAAVNLRLAAACRDHGAGILVPFGTVNPTLPDWQDDLRRCHEDHRMPGLRLYPNYHGYRLDDPRFAALLDAAAARSVPVQIAVAMEDSRTQHPLLHVPPVDPTPLTALVEQRPSLRVVLLNLMSLPPNDRLKALFRTGRVWADTAMLEGVAAVERFIAGYGSDRILLGSHAPFFCHDAPSLKLQESELTDDQRAAVSQGNARAVLGGT